MLGNFSRKINILKKKSGILLECQMVWIHSVGPDWNPNYLQRLLADDKRCY